MRQCLTKAFPANLTLATGGGMRERTKIASFLLASSLAALGPSPAFSDDLLVMPYACAVVGGRALLTPAQNQGHRIIGAREQRAFRACSPMDPTLCRQWTIHRFEIDCDGTALPWAAVVANARPDRAWLENGRVHVRMPANWTLAADDPCAGEQRWRYSRLQRYCADRRALTAPASVEMPAGFAPLLGIDAIFVTPSPPKGAGQVAAYSAQPPAETPFSGNVARSAREPQASEAPRPPARAPAPARELAANPDPSTAAPAAVHPAPAAPALPFAANVARSAREPQPSETLKPHVQAPPPVKEPAASPDLSTAASLPAAASAPVVPRIINRPGAVAEPAASVPATALAQTTSSLRETPVLSLRPDAPEPGTSSLASPGAAVAVVASVLLALTAVIAMLVRGRRPRVGPNRDIARLSIGEPTRQPMVARGVPAARGPSAIWSTAAGASPSWNEEVPRTRADALQVLGMGVTADANLAAIKKIVDGLRQTWHPDLARDPSEREVREKRMKQINVAWDILAAKPART
jgi:hypothetical protein